MNVYKEGRMLRVYVLYDDMTFTVGRELGKGPSPSVEIRKQRG